MLLDKLRLKCVQPTMSTGVKGPEGLGAGEGNACLACPFVHLPNTRAEINLRRSTHTGERSEEWRRRESVNGQIYRVISTVLDVKGGRQQEIELESAAEH